MTIPRGTVKKKCNTTPWPDESLLVTGPVLDSSYLQPVQNDLYMGRDNVTPPVWTFGPSMMPDMVWGGGVDPATYKGNQCFYAAVLPQVWINYTPPQLPLPPGMVQYEFQTVYLFDCGPWSGSWPASPPPILSVVETWASQPVFTHLFTGFNEEDLPHIYAVATSGWMRFSDGAGSEVGWTYGGFQISGSPYIDHFSP